MHKTNKTFRGGGGVVVAVLRPLINNWRLDFELFYALRPFLRQKMAPLWLYTRNHN